MKYKIDIAIKMEYCTCETNVLEDDTPGLLPGTKNKYGLIQQYLVFPQYDGTLICL